MFGGVALKLYLCNRKQETRSLTIKKDTTMKQNLEYTTKQINANFRIKVSGVFNGKKINKLVGVAGALALIGVEMLNKLLKRAFSSLADKCVCKLRRGLKFSFYCK